MRRNEREITTQDELREVIAKSEYGVIAMLDGAAPYSIPLNFAYDGEYLYAHSAHQGKKIDVLKACPQVCITFVPEAVLVPGKKDSASCTMHYRTVNVMGQAEVLGADGDQATRLRGLKCIAEHFGVGHLPLAEPVVAKTTVIRIKPSQITGKRNPAKQA